jgi:putative tricarboxylic transport membrane protein
VWVKLLKIPRPYLFAGIVTFALLGAYAINGNIFDLQVAFMIGIVGFLFRRFGLPLTPLILGLILGPNLELQFRRTLQISAGEYSALIATPMAKILYLMILLVLLVPFLFKVFKKSKLNTQR